MLTVKINVFLEYCKTTGFRDKSIGSLSRSLNEFKKLLREVRLRKIPSITYEHPSSFVADYGTTSVHVKKARIWLFR